MNSERHLSKRTRQFRGRQRRPSVGILAAANVKVVAVTAIDISSAFLATAVAEVLTHCLSSVRKNKTSIIEAATVKRHNLVIVALAVICAILLSLRIQKHYIEQFYFEKGSGGGGPIVDCAKETATYVVAATLPPKATTSPPKFLKIHALTGTAETGAKILPYVISAALVLLLRMRCCAIGLSSFG